MTILTGEKPYAVLFGMNCSSPEFRLLPVELLEMILTKAALVQMYSKDTAKRQSDESIFSNLASVEFRWRCSVKKYNLRSKVRHLSKVYFKRVKMRSTIIRTNRNFLKEVIDPDKIILPLKSCGCLTEDQVTFLTRLRNRKDKNHELLVMLQDTSSHKYSKFVDCLFATNQTPAALVLERGGEAAKVRINNGNATRIREFEVKFIERIQQMQTENMPIFIDMLNASVEKILNGVFILHAKLNKGIELWFWCETETSLNRLKGLSDDDLREIIQRMYQRLIQGHSTFLEPQFIQMDNSLISDVAERRLSIRHVGHIDNLIGFDANALGMTQFSKCVTSLADKIYIAQADKILVYEKKYPYHAKEPIVFGGEIITLGSLFIVSCNINKCLYISYGGNYILNVEPELENSVSIWQEEIGLIYLSISVTSRGHVLVPVYDVAKLIKLLIFTPEGTDKRTIIMGKFFSDALFMEEIIPDIVAFSYDLRCIAIMRLDDNGTILRHIKWHQKIVALSSFRYGDLLIGVPQYKPAAFKRVNSSDFVSLNLDRYHIGSQLEKYDASDNFYYDESYDNKSVQLRQWPFDSKVARDLLTIDERIYGIHFAADQKQLYVLFENKLHIYQLNYENEDCCP